MLKLLLLTTYILSVNAADILVLSSVASISHSRWYGKLALLLANHGHQVVVLDTDKNFFEHANITHIKMSGAYGWLNQMEEMVRTDPKGMDVLIEPHSTLEIMINLADPNFLQCDIILKSEEAQRFMKQYKGKKFDLVIADGFCESFFGFVHYFGNPPLINACPFYEVMAADYAGQFDNPSYAPYHFSSFSPRMSFIERLQNTFNHYVSYYIIRAFSIPANDKIMREIFGPKTPSLDAILRNNLALVMTGYSHVLHGAKPLPPNIVPIPAFHAEPPKAIPKEMQKFLDGAKDGAILFSMGSNFKSVLMSEEKREMFLSIFRNIPQRVIWKLELENATNIPPNVMITKWLPQNDILGHPNVKVFISHGGLLGTQEAVYHGVPVLGIPIMYDQTFNIKRLEEHGVGMTLNYKNLNRKYIAMKLDKILNDPSYSYQMKKLSTVFRDSPETPQQRALFWIEYVLKNAHSKKNYLRPSSLDLEWYQRLLLDVAAFLIACLIFVYYLVKFVLKLIFYLLCGLSKKNNANVTKKKQ